MPGAVPYQPVDVKDIIINEPLNNYSSHETATDGLKRARVLYDYDAKDATELSLMADEVII